MSRLKGAGFTLVELILALALLGFVAAGLWRVLDALRQASFAQAQRVDLERTLRASAVILPAELRELDARDSDITAMSATSIRLRATRQLAFLCTLPRRLPDGALALSVRRHPSFGMRQSFSAGDSVLLYVEGDPATPRDDRWWRGQIRAVADEDCPDAAEPRAGYQISVDLVWSLDGPLDLRDVSRGAPLRGFESVAYTLYRSPADTQWYLGQQGQDEAIQPLIGPLTGATGVTFAYLDSTGAPTASQIEVAAIEIRVRARTPLPVRAPGAPRPAYEVDSVVVRVALRNNPRARSGL